MDLNLPVNSLMSEETKTMYLFMYFTTCMYVILAQKTYFLFSPFNNELPNILNEVQLKYLNSTPHLHPPLAVHYAHHCE